MRPTSGLLPLVLAAALAAPSAAWSQDSLMTVKQATALNPDVPDYVEELRQVVQQHGQTCTEVSHINAYSTASGLRTLIACDAGAKRYEILAEGDSLTVTSQN